MTRPDPGLQPERTALAWRRTALGLAAAAAVAARVLFPTLGVLAVCLAAVGGAGAIGLWVWGSRRYRQVHRRPDGVALAGFAVLATAAGLAALLFVCRR
ncbi:DUF202 domain-containing protein [Pseudonocardia acaciae]|uniref:DUF202 domain-containing protein n=1 Tax=Pseudonocardia acaciae TaxID=551276 RepID=UPI0006844542|nr:DUF202 domain-containing protein [Pseudonocardia acaciae]